MISSPGAVGALAQWGVLPRRVRVTTDYKQLAAPLKLRGRGRRRLYNRISWEVVLPGKGEAEPCDQGTGDWVENSRGPGGKFGVETSMSNVGTL